MVKLNETIRRHSTNCLNVFDHFVELAVEGLAALKIPEFVSIDVFWSAYRKLQWRQSSATVKKDIAD